LALWDDPQRDRGIVGPDQLPDPPPLRQGELGLGFQSGRGRAAGAFSRRPGRRGRGRRPLGAPRPAAGVLEAVARFPVSRADAVSPATPLETTPRAAPPGLAQGPSAARSGA